MNQTGMSVSTNNDPHKRWIRNADGTWINEAALSTGRPNFTDLNVRDEITSTASVRLGPTEDQNYIHHFGSPIEQQFQ